MSNNNPLNQSIESVTMDEPSDGDGGDTSMTIIPHSSSSGVVSQMFEDRNVSLFPQQTQVNQNTDHTINVNVPGPQTDESSYNMINNNLMKIMTVLGSLVTKQSLMDERQKIFDGVVHKISEEQHEVKNVLGSQRDVIIQVSHGVEESKRRDAEKSKNMTRLFNQVGMLRNVVESTQEIQQISKVHTEQIQNMNNALESINAQTHQIVNVSKENRGYMSELSNRMVGTEKAVQQREMDFNKLHEIQSQHVAQTKESLQRVQENIGHRIEKDSKKISEIDGLKNMVYNLQLKSVEEEAKREVREVEVPIVNIPPSRIFEREEEKVEVPRVDIPPLRLFEREEQKLEVLEVERPQTPRLMEKEEVKIPKIDNFDLDNLSMSSIKLFKNENKKDSIPNIVGSTSLENIMDPNLTLRPFHGNMGDDLDSWIFHVNQIKQIKAWSDSQAYMRASLSLKGKAYEVFRSASTSDKFKSTLDGLLKILKRRFGPSDPSSHWTEKLLVLKQRGSESIRDYISKFRKILNKVKENTENAFSEKSLVKMFKRSLRDDIRREVERFDPRTLEKAYKISIKATTILSIGNSTTEINLIDSQYRNSYNRFGNTRNYISRNFRQRNFPNRSFGNFRRPWQPRYNQQSNFNNRNFRRYSNQNSQQRFNQQMTCYNCNKPGHFAINCRMRKNVFPKNTNSFSNKYNNNSNNQFRKTDLNSQRQRNNVNLITSTETPKERRTPTTESEENILEVNCSESTDVNFLIASCVLGLGCHENKHNFVIDSGASMSLIQTDLAENLVSKEHAIFHNMSDADTITLRGADGNKLPIEGQISTRVFFNEHCSIDHVFLVVNEISRNLLLGVDYLHNTHSLLDFGKRIMTSHIFDQIVTVPLSDQDLVSDKESIPDSTLYTVRKYILPPLSQIVVEVSPPWFDKYHLMSVTGIVKTRNYDKISHNFYVVKGIIDLHKGRAHIVLCNESTAMIHIENQQPVATFEHKVPPKSLDIFYVSTENTIMQAPDVLEKDDDLLLAPRQKSHESETLENKLKHFQISSSLDSEDRAKILKLLIEFQDIFVVENSALRQCNAPPVEIETGNSPPIFIPPRRMSPKQREEVDKQIDKMLRAGVITKIESPYSSPIVLVRKTNGSFRCCIDFRKLNQACEENNSVTRYPLPNINDALDALQGSVVFSVGDLQSGYWQLKLHPKDIYKTAFVTPSGQFAFKVMPMGWSLAAGKFQSTMDGILAGIRWKTCLMYQDDIIVFSKTFEEHLIHLREVFTRFRKAQLQMNIKKSSFGKSEVKYLGHLVSKEGTKMDPDKVEKINKFPRPTTVKEIRSFLGICSYYRRYCKDFANISSPLCDLLKKNSKFHWVKEHEKSFQDLKIMLSTEPVLAYPDYDKEFILQTDGSAKAIGAVLSQINDADEEHPICYLSRKLSDAETRYDAREIELLAIVWSTQQLEFMLAGKPFRLETDCKNLKWLMSNDKPGRLARWRLKLNRFQMKICYRKGSLNTNADVLSRTIYPEEKKAEILLTSVSIPNTTEMYQKQLKDPLFGQVIKSFQDKNNENSPEVKEFLSGRGKFRLNQNSGILEFSNKSSEIYRVVVPPSIRSKIITAFHSIPTAGHLGIKKTMDRLCKRFYWPNMFIDVKSFLAGCLPCQKKRFSRPRKQGKMRLFQSLYPFHTVQMDILGPFVRTPRNKAFTLVIIDRFTHYITLASLTSMTSQECAEKFHVHIICNHGVPKRLLTDRGAAFTSKMFKYLNKRLGIEKIFTLSYTPTTNGLCERVNRYIKSALYACIEKDETSWDLFLPDIAFAYNTSILDSIKTYPFSLVYGRESILPTDVLMSKEEDFVKDESTYHIHNTRRLHDAFQKAIEAQAAYNQTMKQKYDSKQKDTEFSVGDLVLLYTPKFEEGSRKLQSVYSGPFKVIEKVNDLNYRIKNPHSNKEQRVNIRRIILYNPPREDDIVDKNMTPEKVEKTISKNDLVKEQQKTEPTPEIIDKRLTESGCEYKLSIGSFSEWKSKSIIPKELIIQFENKRRNQRKRKNSNNNMILMCTTEMARFKRTRPRQRQFRRNVRTRRMSLADILEPFAQQIANGINRHLNLERRIQGVIVRPEERVECEATHNSPRYLDRNLSLFPPPFLDWYQNILTNFSVEQVEWMSNFFQSKDTKTFVDFCAEKNIHPLQATKAIQVRFSVHDSNLHDAEKHSSQWWWKRFNKQNRREMFYNINHPLHGEDSDIEMKIISTLSPPRDDDTYTPSPPPIMAAVEADQEHEPERNDQSVEANIQSTDFHGTDINGRESPIYDDQTPK
jgi:transposase InsO family protein